MIKTHVVTSFFEIKKDCKNDLHELVEKIDWVELREENNKFKIKAKGSLITLGGVNFIKTLQSIITDDEVVILKEFDINDDDIDGVVTAIDSKKVYAHTTDDLVALAQKKVKIIKELDK